MDRTPDSDSGNAGSIPAACIPFLIGVEFFSTPILKKANGRKGAVTYMDFSKIKDRLKKANLDKVLDFVRKNIRYFAAGAMFIVLVVVLFGALGLGYKKVYVDANREIFKHSIAYTEEAAQFITKEYREYNSTDDTAERKAIMQYVADRYPNLDMNEIENADLKAFYRKCLLTTAIDYERRVGSPSSL